MKSAVIISHRADLFFFQKKKKKKVLKDDPQSVRFPLRLCEWCRSPTWKRFFVHISECPATPHCLLHQHLHPLTSCLFGLLSSFLSDLFSALYHERWHLIPKHPSGLSLRCFENICLYFHTLLKKKLKEMTHLRSFSRAAHERSRSDENHSVGLLFFWGEFWQ